VIVKILEVWFLSSVPIGIAVGRLLERGSAPLAGGTLQLVRSVAGTDRSRTSQTLPPDRSSLFVVGDRSPTSSSR
jgi:hypothetical protein